VSKEEIIAAVKECAEKLGHVPSFPELQVTMKVSKRAVRAAFGTYTEALAACGLVRRGAGYEVSQRDLFLDWAGLVRRLGKVPTITDYEQHGEYSLSPMMRCYGSWKQLPEGMWEYAKKEGLEGEWEDVLKIAAEHLEPGKVDARRSRPLTVPKFEARPFTGQPMYGTPLMHEVMCYAPTNEMGVMVLFGAEAKRLGFKILRLQAGCPDCEAMVEVAPGRWQRIRIEFEYESRNFLAHMHSPDGCDLIVCWEHNWQNCPVPVLCLREALSSQRSALSENL
jgi:Homing endonuclease associated repeat